MDKITLQDILDNKVGLNSIPSAPTLTFPADLRRPESDYPFMMFEIVEYPASVGNFIRDNEKQSSVIESFKAGVKNIGEFDKNILKRNGITDPVPRGKRKRKATIVLPITNNVATSVGASWQMVDLVGTQAALGAINDIGNSIRNGGNPMDMASGIGRAGADLLIATNTKYLSNLLQKTVNVIVNPKQQALFNGVEPRTFQFDYVFTPTNEKEAETLEEIIRTFTKFSLPSASPNALLFKFPQEFLISFHGVKGFPIISSCVCVGITANFTPNTLQLLKSGHAVQVVISMAFMETTIRTQEHPGI